MDKLPHGLKGKLKTPVPEQDALQFKVDEVMEKKTMLKEEEIFETTAQFDKRVKERLDRQVKKNKEDIAQNGKGKKTQKKKPKIEYKKTK
jgi:hypothetical protein